VFSFFFYSCEAVPSCTNCTNPTNKNRLVVKPTDANSSNAAAAASDAAAAAAAAAAADHDDKEDNGCVVAHVLHSMAHPVM